VPGGGVAYCARSRARQAEGAEEQQQGVDIVKRAIVQPLWKIARTPVEAPSSSTRCAKARLVRVQRSHRGVRGSRQGGVIDPTRSAAARCRNAASVASLLLTTEAMVARR